MTPSLLLAKRLLCEMRLKEFIKAHWHIIEASPFVDGWHIDAICEHLEAAYNGDIRHLLINMPPRCAKSLLVSVFFFCWCWAKNPSLRFIYSSYAQNLSVRDSVKCRRIIESATFQSMWGDVFQLSSDQNTKIKFENDKGGHRMASSVGGLTTGEGGDFIISDDPQSAVDAYSPKVIQSTKDWWDNGMSTRGNDVKTVVFIIVMQRLAETDMSAHVLAQGGYTHLFLPMEFESERRCITSIGWEDPRTEEGELLWPERFNRESINNYKRRMNPYAYAGQQQQRPAPKGGGKFKREWFEVVKAAPAVGMRVRYWDRAGTEVNAAEDNDPDWTVGVLMCKTADNVCYIEDLVRFRASDLGVLQGIKNTASLDSPMVEIGLEQDPGQAGKADVNQLIRQLMGYNAKAHLASKDKVTRATPLSAQAEAGNIKLVKGHWNEEFLRELETFPMGLHDDQVDAAAGAFNTLCENLSNFEGMTKE